MVLPTEEFVLTQQIRSGVDNQALYPLTSAQHEVWFDQLLHRDMPLYNIGGYMSIHDVIDPKRLGSAVTLVASSQEALRTILVQGQSSDDVPMQMFVDSLSLQVPLHE